MGGVPEQRHRLQTSELSEGSCTSPWGALPVRESSCIMSGGVSAPPSGRCHCSPPGLRRPNELRQISWPGVNWPHASNSSLQQKCSFISIKCGFKIWLNPFNLWMTPRAGDSRSAFPGLPSPPAPAISHSSTQHSLLPYPALMPLPRPEGAQYPDTREQEKWAQGNRTGARRRLSPLAADYRLAGSALSWNLPPR